MPEGPPEKEFLAAIPKEQRDSVEQLLELLDDEFKMEDANTEYQAHKEYENFRWKPGSTIESHMARERGVHEGAKDKVWEGKDMPERTRAFKLLDSCQMAWGEHKLALVEARAHNNERKVTMKGVRHALRLLQSRRS